MAYITMKTEVVAELARAKIALWDEIRTKAATELILETYQKENPEQTGLQKFFNIKPASMSMEEVRKGFDKGGHYYDTTEMMFIRMRGRNQSDNCERLLAAALRCSEETMVVSSNDLHDLE